MQVRPHVCIGNAIAVVIDVIAQFHRRLARRRIARNPVVRIIAGPDSRRDTVIHSSRAARPTPEFVEQLLPRFVGFAVAVVVDVVAQLICARIHMIIRVVAVVTSGEAVTIRICRSTRSCGLRKLLARGSGSRVPLPPIGVSGCIRSGIFRRRRRFATADENDKQGSQIFHRELLVCTQSGAALYSTGFHTFIFLSMLLAVENMWK